MAGRMAGAARRGAAILRNRSWRRRSCPRPRSDGPSAQIDTSYDLPDSVSAASIAMQTTCVSAPAATAAVQQRAARLRQSSFRPGMQCRGAAPAAAAAAAAGRAARSLSVLAFRWDPRDLKASEKIQVSRGAPTRAKGCRRCRRRRSRRQPAPPCLALPPSQDW